MNSYMNVWASLMNVATRFSAMYSNYNFGDIQDFDDTDGTQLPGGNLLGIYQLNYSENSGLMMAQVAFPITVENDVSSLILNQATGDFTAFVRNQTTHPFYDYSTSGIIGTMTAANSLSVSPMIRSPSRQFKNVLQTFMFDLQSAFQPNQS